MLSVGKVGGKSGGGASAAKYYTTGDYYSKDESETGEWHGKGAQRLGLQGEVKPQDLAAILEGRFGEGQETSWDAKGGPGIEERRLGFDWTFSPSKSVSIMALVAGDKRILSLVKDANDKGMDYLERYAATRVRESDGSITVKPTGNVIRASFLETTSRSMDPQLHVHNPTANATYDEDRGKWYALHAQEMYRSMKAADRVATAELARGLLKLGYELDIDREVGSFEIKGVGQDTIELFSKRSAAIEDAAGLREQSTAAERDRHWKLTRADKVKADGSTLEAIHRLELREAFDERKVGQSPQDLDQIRDAAKGELIYTEVWDVSRAVRYGLETAYATEAVFEERNVVERGMRHGLGRLAMADFQGEMARLEETGAIIRPTGKTGDRPFIHAITTPEIVKAETKYRDLVKRGRGSVRPIHSEKTASERLDRFRIQTKAGAMPLSDEQKNAALKILTTEDRYTVVQGTAGAGKTEMIAAVMAAAPQRPHWVLAPTGQAVENAKEKTGAQGQTVQRTLLTGAREIAAGSVVYVDEASMMDIHMAQRLSELAKLGRFRLVTMGDREQLPAIGAGRPHSDSLRVASTIAQMETQYRQREGSQADIVARTVKAGQAWHRERSVPPKERIAPLRPNPWPSLKDALGTDLIEVGATEADGYSRDRRVIRAEVVEYASRDWLAADDDNRSPVLVLDNLTRVALNQSIQDGRAAKGELDDNKRVEATILSPKPMSTAEKREAWSYQSGQVLVFHKDMKSYGINAQDRLEVVGNVGDSVLRLRPMDGGKEKKFNIGRNSSSFGVYNRAERSLMPGDRIVTTAKQGDAHNGTQGTVQEITGRQITFETEGGKTHSFDLDKNQHWDLGYGVTFMRAQGATMNTSRIVLLSGDKNALSAKSANTAVTRAREIVKIYTDSFNTLTRQFADTPGEKTSALEALETGTIPLRPDKTDIEASANTLPPGAERDPKGRFIADAMLSSIVDLIKSGPALDFKPSSEAVDAIKAGMRDLVEGAAQFLGQEAPGKNEYHLTDEQKRLRELEDRAAKLREDEKKSALSGRAKDKEEKIAAFSGEEKTGEKSFLDTRTDNTSKQDQQKDDQYRSSDWER